MFHDALVPFAERRNIKMKKIIKTVYPPITTYPSIANILSLKWGEKEKIMPWIGDHLIQIIVRPRHQHTFGDFYDHADLDNFYRLMYGMPGLEWMRVNKPVAAFTKFSDYVEHLIDRDYCLEACLDRFYFEFSESYNKTHYIHSTFIYGYDNEKNIMYISDFFSGDRYEKKEVSYDEINASMNNNWIIAIFGNGETEYQLNEKLMKISFEEYLNSRDSFKKYEFSHHEYNQDVIYGLEYYDYLIDRIKRDGFVDVRMYHLLYDHKILMKFRLEYLVELERYNSDKLESLIKKTETLIHESLVTRSCAMLFDFNKTKAKEDNLIEMIANLKQKDREFVEETLCMLNETIN